MPHLRLMQGASLATTNSRGLATAKVASGLLVNYLTRFGLSIEAPCSSLTSRQALQSVFKGRVNDARGRENAVERCDVSVQDRPDKTECRLIVKMICKNGELLYLET